MTKSTTSNGSSDPKPRSPFTIDNIPYGVISTKENPTPRCATAFEEDAVDLSLLENDDFFASVPGFEGRIIFAQDSLNDFAALPRTSQIEVRKRLTGFLSEDSFANRDKYFIPLKLVTHHYPMATSNFSDFYCSLEHSRNCSEIMGLNIQSNWFYAPSVYSGRTSSLVVSGTPIRRPCGVVQSSPKSDPVYSSSKRLDFELEMGVFLSKPLPAGQRLNIEDAADHIFGFVILNDWSSRDIQGFEMPPLGPFHGKGFGTSISPWIVTMETLRGVEHASTTPQDPRPLLHLAWKGAESAATFDIDLAAKIIRNGKVHHITSTNLKELYWTPYQQLTHLASAGEKLCVGDVFGTGTISSDRVDDNGEKIGLACLLERHLPRNKLAVMQEAGMEYLEDGDEVVMEGWCRNAKTGGRFGFGQCRGVILPPLEIKS